ncbi:MAG: hypothetical protein P1U89_23230 [Verrucomicrobiales bacterium]|nr:hypothetical protein [Verrucomicrobiales bacterium]
MRNHDTRAGEAIKEPIDYFCAGKQKGRLQKQATSLPNRPIL